MKMDVWVLRAVVLWISSIAFLSPQESFAQAEVLNHPERGGFGLEALRSPQTVMTAAPLRTYPNFDRRLSLFVTDIATVEQLTFSDVMGQLVAQSGDVNLTPLALFQQWWDTAGVKPGLGRGPHCNDESEPIPSPESLATMNGFPYRCPRREADEAQSDPFAAPESDAGYSAIALVNRFDLASSSGADCGEARVVFARNSGQDNGVERNLIIFEARLPNPKADLGLDGCRPIVEFWLGLSEPTMSTSERGRLLRDFYLKGLPADGVGPVIAVDNFVDGSGQIRTNQFLHQAGVFDWTLREFKLLRDAGSIKVVPVTVKTNPGNELLRANSSDARASKFADEVIAQMPDLLGGTGGPGNLLTFAFSVNDNALNSFESDERDPHLGDVVAAFKEQPGGTLSDRIQQALKAAGSSLTPDEVVARIGVMTCAGCHRYSNGDSLGAGAVWPASLGFTHVTEETDELQQGPDGPGTRYAISDALESVLLPAREEIMTLFLNRFAPSE